MFGSFQLLLNKPCNLWKKKTTRIQYGKIRPRHRQSHAVCLTTAISTYYTISNPFVSYFSSVSYCNSISFVLMNKSQINKSQLLYVFAKLNCMNEMKFFNLCPFYYWMNLIVWIIFLASDQYDCLGVNLTATREEEMDNIFMCMSSPGVSQSKENHFICPSIPAPMIIS
jgi:hypothetical protein